MEAKMTAKTITTCHRLCDVEVSGRHSKNCLSWETRHEFETEFSYLLVHRAEGKRYIYRVARWVYKTGSSLEYMTEHDWAIIVHEKETVEAIKGMGGKGWKKLSSAKDNAMSIEYWGY